MARLGEFGELRGGARLGFEVGSQASRGTDLGVDVDLGRDRRVRTGACARAHRLCSQRLGRVTLVGSRDVRGRDRDQVRRWAVRMGIERAGKLRRRWSPRPGKDRAG